MKKLILFLAFGFFFTACEVCKDCICVTYQNGAQIGSSTVSEVCGKDDIKAIEGTQTTSSSGGITITTTCNCK